MKRDKIVYGALLCGVVLLCNSCMLGRRQIKSPELELPATVVAGATDSLTMADMAWWNVYSDSTLTALIERTLERNKDMLAASARVRRMRALGRVARADQLPSVSGQLVADTEHNDYDGEAAKNDPEFDAKVSLAWELDLWGNLRWANRKAVAEYLATVDAQRALQMTLVAEVATAYYELVALDQELSIVRRTLQTRKEGVRQARLRFEGGLTSETALQQAKVELASTATLIPGLESRIALKEHQIALLAGAYPTLRIDRQTMEMHARLPERLKVGLPSELLKRRPDLRQSEQTLRAAEAAMGMASADRFPRITFSLTGGWENDDLKGLFSSPFSYVGGSLVSPLFSFGKKKAKYKAALAACDEARLNYEQKVLEAFREVNDAVVTYRNVRTAAALKRDLQQAAQKYVELAQLQYFNGVINYLDVLDAQRKYFDAQTLGDGRPLHGARRRLGRRTRVVPADTDCLSPVRRSAAGGQCYFVTAFTSGRPSKKSLIFCSVVSVMLCIASAVKKAWCDVTITLGKSSSRASVSSSMIESDRSS